MKKYYLILDGNSSLVDVIEGSYTHELGNYFNELEQEGYSYKEVSYLKYKEAQNILWEKLTETKDIYKTYSIADKISFCLKFIIIMVVIDLILTLLIKIQN